MALIQLEYLNHKMLSLVTELQSIQYITEIVSVKQTKPAKTLQQGKFREKSMMDGINIQGTPSVPCRIQVP